MVWVKRSIAVELHLGMFYTVMGVISYVMAASKLSDSPEEILVPQTETIASSGTNLDM